jgi:hypothetical protein
MQRTVTSRGIASVVAACLALAALAVRPAHGLAGGDVGVTVDASGKATVTGGDAGVDFTVTWDGVTGAYTFTGGSGTTIGGAASVSVAGVRSFVVTTGAGADNVVFDHTPIPGNLNVHLGDGDDTLDLFDVTVGGAAKLFGEAGNDAITARDQSSFKHTLTIKGGGGEDTIILRTANFHGNVRIIGGPMDDHVTLNAVDLYGHAELAVLGHAGNDWLGIAESTFRQPVWVGMGRGSDLVTITTSRFMERVGLVGGGADDFLNVGVDVEWSHTRNTRVTEFELGNSSDGVNDGHGD